MTTSDANKQAEQLAGAIDLTGSQRALAAGMPDPAILAQMAKALFNFSPEISPQAATLLAVDGLSLPTQAAALPTSQLPLSALSIPAIPPAGATIPTTASAGAIPASFPGAIVPPLPVSNPPFQSPGINGGISSADISPVPSFSFLEEARSLFAPAASIPATPPATTGVLSEDQLRSLPASLSTAPSPTFPSAASSVPLSSPQIPGAPVSGADVFRDPTFGFLADANSIVPIEVFPTLAPVSSDLGANTAIDYSSGPFDVNAIRRDFPILQGRVNGRQLIWLDNAATTQKPQAVIDRLAYFYQHENSNIHRAAHTLAARATDAYEAAREKVRRFLNAGSVKEIIFVRGATEGINLIAQSWGKRNINKDDEIIVTHLEHHANIVPWQMICAEKGAKLRVAPVDNTGQIILEEYEKLFTPRTSLVSLAHVSNALGTITPVQQMVEIAHRYGAKVVVDGAQAISHMRVDVQAYDCDFYVFSGHKVFAPTGIGVVYGKESVLDSTPPYQGGGNMIADVTFEKTQYNPPPSRFEAGTGNIADAVGLGAAIDYLDRIGMANIERYEHDLLIYGTERLQTIPGLHLIGTAREKASVLSFVLDGFKTDEVGTALNQEGIAVRSGHHCAQPILRRFGQESTVRPSLAFYNTCEEIDALIAAIWNIKNSRHPGLR